jgi:hypothetical protein
MFPRPFFPSAGGHLYSSPSTALAQELSFATQHGSTMNDFDGSLRHLFTLLAKPNCTANEQASIVSQITCDRQANEARWPHNPEWPTKGSKIAAMATATQSIAISSTRSSSVRHLFLAAFPNRTPSLREMRRIPTWGHTLTDHIAGGLVKK